MTAAKKFVILALVSCVSTAAPCVGSSAGLRAATCAAWQEFYDSTFAHATGCVGTRDAPCSCTEGVRCNATDITAITLGQINLTGTIPESIGRIVGLEVLELGFNALVGTVPASLRQLQSLRAVVFANNSLGGRIPDFDFAAWVARRGFCAFGGGANRFCTPLPAGATAICTNVWGPVVTNGTCAPTPAPRTGDGSMRR